MLRGGRERLVRLIFRGVLRAFGVRLDIRGGADFLTAPAGRGALVVNNHISWLDIVAINALRPMRALAKKEIASWPVLGGLVRRGGSIFLDRERLTTLPATMAELADALRAGSLVSVTPEGTTWCGLASGRFTTATFQAAIDGGVPVRPIALRYRLADGRETSRPAFIGPESLIASLRRVAALRGPGAGGLHLPGDRPGPRGEPPRTGRARRVRRAFRAGHGPDPGPAAAPCPAPAAGTTGFASREVIRALSPRSGDGPGLRLASCSCREPGLSSCVDDRPVRLCPGWLVPGCRKSTKPSACLNLLVRLLFRRTRRAGRCASPGMVESAAPAPPLQLCRNSATGLLETDPVRGSCAGWSPTSRTFPEPLSSQRA